MNHRPTAATHPPLRVRRRADLRLSTEDGGRRVIVLDEERDRQFRLSAEAARLLELLDGTRSSAQIAELLGDRSVDAAAVDQAIAKLMDLGLVESTAPGAATNHPVHTRSSGGRHRLPRSAYPPPRWRTPDPNRRFRFRPPGTLELSFGNPGQVLAALRPVADALTGAAGRVAVGAVLVAAAVAVPLTWRDRVADVSQPAPVWVFAALFASSLVVTMAHELGHGLSLVRAGGKVRRLGMLLLYGSPAFYCDVSQAWRLAPRRRLWVALAGVRVNITVGAAAAVNAAMLPPGPFRQLLSGMTVFNLLLSLLNLCPFVKFDGYVGLAGLLDHPNLRTKAMAAARDLIGRVIYGGRRPVERPTERMAPGWVLYGFGCLLVTPAAVGWALLNYEPDLRAALKRGGFLTRDPRVVERKKYGKAKARRSFQFSKR